MGLRVLRRFPISMKAVLDVVNATDYTTIGLENEHKILAADPSMIKKHEWCTLPATYNSAPTDGRRYLLLTGLPHGNWKRNFKRRWETETNAILFLHQDESETKHKLVCHGTKLKALKKGQFLWWVRRESRMER